MKLSHSLLSLALLAALPMVANAERGFEVRDLAKLDRVSSPILSPDGRKLVFATRVMDFDANKASTSLWIEDLMARDAAPPARLTPEGWNVNSPAFSPDGQSLVMTLSREGGSQLFSIRRDGTGLRRLAQSSAIDTEAVFSPDGQQIFFVSDRGGGPQVYRMPASGGSAERVTFNGSYNISPAISPDGKTLAFVTRQGGAFKVCVQDLASGTVQQISDTSEDESPSFAPNGRLLVYATRTGGRDVLMTSTLDGRIKAKLVSTTADVREPTWGPFGR